MQGVRPTELDETPHHPAYGLANAAAAGASASNAASALRIQCSDPGKESGSIQELYRGLAEAKKKAGDSTIGSFDSFHSFVEKKTAQLRKQYGCAAVEFSVEMQQGKVHLKARPKK